MLTHEASARTAVSAPSAPSPGATPNATVPVPATSAVGVAGRIALLFTSGKVC